MCTSTTRYRILEFCLMALMVTRVCPAQITDIEAFFPLCEGTEWQMTQNLGIEVLGQRDVNGTTGTVVQWRKKDTEENIQHTYLSDEEGIKLLEMRTIDNFRDYISGYTFDPPIVVLSRDTETSDVQYQETVYTSFSIPAGSTESYKAIRSSYLLEHHAEYLTGIGNFEDVIQFTLEISIHPEPIFFKPETVENKQLPMVFSMEFWLAKNFGYIKSSDWVNRDPLEVMSATICNSTIELAPPVELPNLKPSIPMYQRKPVNFSRRYTDSIYGDFYSEDIFFDEEDDIYVNWAVRNDWITTTPLNQTFNVSLLIDGRQMDSWIVDSIIPPWEQYNSDYFLIEQPLAGGWHDIELQIDRPDNLVLEVIESDNTYTETSAFYVERKNHSEYWTQYD